MTFGSWTYNGNQVDLRHIDAQNQGDFVEIGIDLTEYYISGEWDLMEVRDAIGIDFTEYYI